MIPESLRPDGSADPDPTSEHAEGYRGRVTVDVDGYAPRWRLVAIRAWHHVERLAAAAEIHVSSSGEGLHVIGWYDEPLTHEDRDRIRRTLGDDTKRVEIDHERHEHGVYTGVLWSEKRDEGGDGTPHDARRKDRSFRNVYDALAHIDATTGPSDYERIKALANDGHKGAPALARHLGDA